MGANVENRISKVYIVQYRPGIDYEDAKVFGKLAVLLPDEKNIVLNEARMRRMFQVGLKDFSDDDYLLATGSPAALMLAGAIAMRANNGKAKILQWDRVESKYYVLELET